MKNVTPEQFRMYQEKAKTTDIYPRHRHTVCLSLGLISEVGEVAGLFKKHHRDGGDFPLKELKLELGDCLWYVTRITNCYGMRYEKSNIQDAIDFSTPENASETIIYMMNEALNIVYEMSALYVNKTSLNVLRLSIYRFLAAINKLLILHDISMTEIMEMNIAKLAKRYEKKLEMDSMFFPY